MKRKSNYGGMTISDAQWLTELLCERMSEDQLPDSFWKLPKWRKIFSEQIGRAHSLLNLYCVEAIAKAINDERIESIRSFNAFFKVPLHRSILEKHQLELSAPIHIPTRHATDQKPAKGPKKRNLLTERGHSRTTKKKIRKQDI